MNDERFASDKRTKAPSILAGQRRIKGKQITLNENSETCNETRDVGRLDERRPVGNGERPGPDPGKGNGKRPRCFDRSLPMEKNQPEYAN